MDELRAEIEQELVKFAEHASASDYQEVAELYEAQAEEVDRIIEHLWARREALCARVRAYHAFGEHWSLGPGALRLANGHWLEERDTSLIITDEPIQEIARLAFAGVPPAHREIVINPIAPDHWQVWARDTEHNVVLQPDACSMLYQGSGPSPDDALYDLLRVWRGEVDSIDD